MKIKLASILLSMIFIFSTPSITEQSIYYQSQWTMVKPYEFAEFQTSFGQIPSFTEIYIGDWMEINDLSSVSATPYHDYPIQCLSIHRVTPDKIIVFSRCDCEMNIRVNAVLYFRTGELPMK
jgi:hypothetical protein